jgi:O-antigen/teichoic acid export membrane protein
MEPIPEAARTLRQPLTLPLIAEREASKPRGRSATERQIRGSSLLLVGRFLSKGTNFAVQVLTVRYLSMTDYGAFAYAMAIVQLGQRIATCGLDRATTRFVPIFQERRDFDRLFGTVFLVVGTVLALGLAIATATQALYPMLEWRVHDGLKYSLLLVLIFLVPLQALDDLVVGLFAVFAKPRAIFFRRHVLAPALKLAVVLLLVLGQSTVMFLSYGYLVASLLGVSIYVVMLVQMMNRERLFEHFSIRTVNIPWREVTAFTVPLLLSDLVPIVMNSMSVVILERFAGLTEVARLRAQQPIAATNQLVMVSFATLFTPVAARMFAKDDRHGLNDLYWQTAMWIAVLSFPIFVLTFSVSAPLTKVLLGSRYHDSALLLSLLSLGYYFNAALGFNGLTLKICGRLRYVVVISLVVVVVNLAANLLLIPLYGALGAAVGTSVAMIAHNVLKQVGLRLGTDIATFERRYMRGYLVIVLIATALLALDWSARPPVPVSLALAGLASALVFRLNRDLLRIDGTFPELTRRPLIRRLLGL